MPPPADGIEAIVRVLAPYVGENMARSAVRGQVEKLRLGARIEGAAAEELLGALAPGLAVFVGREKTKRILDEVRTALGAPGSKA